MFVATIDNRLTFFRRVGDGLLKENVLYTSLAAGFCCGKMEAVWKGNSHSVERLVCKKIVVVFVELCSDFVGHIDRLLAESCDCG